MENWVCIFSSTYLHKVELAKALLEEEGINSVINNKQDSSYLFGEIELHVNPDDVIPAKLIIEKFEHE